MDNTDVAEGQILNCKLSTTLQLAAAANKNPAVGGPTGPDVMVAYTGCLLWTPIKGLGGYSSTARSDTPVFACLNGSGDKSEGVASIFAHNRLVGFNISTFPRQNSRNSHPGDGVVSMFEGKIGDVRVLSTSWKAGDLLRVVIHQDTISNRARQARFLPEGVPKEAYYAELEPTEQTFMALDYDAMEDIGRAVESAEAGDVEASDAMFGYGMVLSAVRQILEMGRDLHADDVESAARGILQGRNPDGRPNSILGNIKGGLRGVGSEPRSRIIAIALTDGISGQNATIYALPLGIRSRLGE